MLALTRKTDYALVALAGLASIEPEPASARTLAKRHSLPLPVLRNILKDLANAGLLRSEQGSSGGYQLQTPPDQITLVDVVEAIEGPVRLTVCCSEDNEQSLTNPCSCSLAGSCGIKDALRHVHTRILELLAEVTIADLASHEATCQIARGDHSPAAASLVSHLQAISLTPEAVR